jgi:hypothetical protein
MHAASPAHLILDLIIEIVFEIVEIMILHIAQLYFSSVTLSEVKIFCPERCPKTASIYVLLLGQNLHTRTK